MRGEGRRCGVRAGYGLIGREVHGRADLAGQRLANVAVMLMDLGLDRVRVEPLLAKPNGHFVIRVRQAQQDVLGGQHERPGVVE
jgi:hypothetical protein